MNLELLSKYLMFLNQECNKYLEDGVVEDEEINQLIIELNRFIVEVKNSDLSEVVKNRVLSIDLNHKINTNTAYYELLGRFDFGKYRRQRRNKKYIQSLKEEIKKLQLSLNLEK